MLLFLKWRKRWIRVFWSHWGFRECLFPSLPDGPTVSRVHLELSYTQNMKQWISKPSRTRRQRSGKRSLALFIFPSSAKGWRVTIERMDCQRSKPWRVSWDWGQKNCFRSYLFLSSTSSSPFFRLSSSAFFFLLLSHSSSPLHSLDLASPQHRNDFEK